MAINTRLLNALAKHELAIAECRLAILKHEKAINKLVNKAKNRK